MCVECAGMGDSATPGPFREPPNRSGDHHLPNFVAPKGQSLGNSGDILSILGDAAMFFDAPDPDRPLSKLEWLQSGYFIELQANWQFVDWLGGLSNPSPNGLLVKIPCHPTLFI
uniref:Uncharacterized protein n=1 Tax=Solanum tuberosum TaxID=4113 RepID=M1DMJ1_SOLTU